MNRSIFLLSSFVLSFALVIGLPNTKSNGSILFSGSSGSLAATAEFTISGNTLTIVLTNTSSADVLVPADVLTGVFFNFAGTSATTFSRTSAVLTAGSSVFYDPDGQPVGGVVGGEFAYKGGLSGAPNGAFHGISSSGLGLFGPHDLFPGPDLADPISPDGLQYGILSAGDNTATGNSAILNSGGLIKNSVTFTLGFSGTLLESNISNVSFQYGTDLQEPNYDGFGEVPEPATLVIWSLLGFAAAGMCLRSRR